MPSKGAKTKQRLIKMAMELFAELGYENVSFQKLADACKISQAATIYHFKNKRGLFAAVISLIKTRLTQITSDMFKPTDNALERMQKFFIGHINWCLIYSNEAELVILLRYLAANDAHFKKINSDLLLAQRDKIQDILLAGKREGLFHFSGPVEQLSPILLDFLTGIMITYLSGGTELTNTGAIKKRVNRVLVAHLVI